MIAYFFLQYFLYTAAYCLSTDAYCLHTAYCLRYCLLPIYCRIKYYSPLLLVRVSSAHRRSCARARTRTRTVLYRSTVVGLLQPSAYCTGTRTSTLHTGAASGPRLSVSVGIVLVQYNHSAMHFSRHTPFQRR